MTIHEFIPKLTQGEQGEAFLDKFFSDRFFIRKASKADQRRGIDRYFCNRETGVRFAVEYKTDRRAWETGNGFVETLSVDKKHKLGWAYRSCAAFLIYYLPQAGLIYVIRMTALRHRLLLWAEKYPMKSARNVGYYTHGIAVPLWEFECCAEQVLSC